jgi:CubicO group peptidase (beta-lactamase class C family)
MIVGSAGLFSTAPDMLNFLEMLLNHGEINGQKYFAPLIMEQIQTNQIVEIGECAGLGWELNQPRYMGRHCGAKTFGKSGFTGCASVCDIQREVGFVILSNYTYPVRKPDAAPINKFRSDIADIIFENL